MAQVIEQDFDFTVRNSRPEKYPYEDWFNGDVWKLDSGTDFPSTPSGFRNTLTQAINREGRKHLTFRSKVVGKDEVGQGSLVIQAFPKEDATAEELGTDVVVDADATSEA